MTREEHLAYCQICTNRKLDFKQGIVCELTNKKADFEKTCDSFYKDEQAELELHVRQMAMANDTPEGDPIDYKKNKKNGMLAMVLGGMVMMISISVGSIPVILIPTGAFIWGASVYKKGLEQEKIMSEINSKKLK